MDIIFSANNRYEVLQLPIVPEGQEWEAPHKNESFDTVQHGELNLIGLSGLTTLNISSFFPNKPYTFAKSGVMGQYCVDFFDKIKRNREPVRIVIISKRGYELLNILVTIESFSWGIDRAGDFPYKLDLKEYKQAVVT
ncbi:hypothetical protein [Bacillus manliponensis]|uniref:hypothetical protein n=1 Tax=Bacillus manliponensis TaxID=574376 RepID=UPI003512B06D